MRTDLSAEQVASRGLVGFQETCHARSSCPDKAFVTAVEILMMVSLPTSSASREILCERSISMMLAFRRCDETKYFEMAVIPVRAGPGSHCVTAVGYVFLF